MTMTKSDRQQLQTLVRRRFRNLKREVEQRRVELLADMEAQVATQFAEEDQAWATAVREVRREVRECNRRLNEIWAPVVGDGYQETDWVHLLGAPPQQAAADRMQLRRAAVSRIDQQVRDAQLTLDNQETDLLEKLLIGGLESDAAHQFLGTVPTVAQLVPASRLAELETGIRWEEVPGDG